jgi:hypothetical protein
MTAFHNPDPDSRIASLLSDYADGVAPLDTLLAQYQVSYAQIADLVELTDRLRISLTEVTPSAAFIEELYCELVSGGVASPSLLGRLSLLPDALLPDVSQRLQAIPHRRMAIAAGIGGLTLALLTARSLSNRMGLRHRGEASREALA